MSKVDTLRETYVGNGKPLKTRSFNVLNEGDTTPTKKYLEYMCSVYPQISNARRIVDEIKLFDSLLPYMKEKDIYSPIYRDILNLFEQNEKAREIKDEKSFNREEHVDVIHETDEYIIVRPKTHKGSLKYGANTRWCTASKNNQSTFNSYSKNKFLIYLVRKKTKGTNWDKVAFYCHNDKNILTDAFVMYNSNDTSVSGRSFMSSDWTLEQVIDINLRIQNYMMMNIYQKITKQKVDGVISSLNKLDLNEFIQNVKFLKNSGQEVDNNINDLLQEISEKLTKVLSI
jgi:hypothetical protein